MRVRKLLTERFQDYKVPSMYLASCFCDWKCCPDKPYVLGKALPAAGSSAAFRFVFSFVFGFIRNNYEIVRKTGEKRVEVQVAARDLFHHFRV